MPNFGIDISSEDIAFYRAHGWWVSGAILSDELLDNLVYAVARYAVGEADRPLPKPILPRWTGAPERGVRQADYLSLQLNTVLEFVCAPPLPQFACALSGATEVRLFHDQLIWKEPGGLGAQASVGWHTDRAYWQSCTSEQMLTAWIPLQDTTAEMGSLAVWDASHLWANTDDLHTFDQPDLQRLEDLARARNQAPKILVLPLRRGQVSFHHCRLVHGSYPNRTLTPRLAFAIHYQDGNNQHTARTNWSRGAIHLNDMLCRSRPDGLPDYSDPDICPMLYSLPDEST